VADPGETRHRTCHRPTNNKVQIALSKQEQEAATDLRLIQLPAIPSAFGIVQTYSEFCCVPLDRIGGGGELDDSMAFGSRLQERKILRTLQ
jgi:hypothetical protein